LLVFVAGMVQGRRDITRIDWAVLAGAGIALVLWAITRDPLLSVITVTAI
jgi:hypothetical protein